MDGVPSQVGPTHGEAYSCVLERLPRGQQRVPLLLSVGCFVNSHQKATADDRTVPTHGPAECCGGDRRSGWVGYQRSEPPQCESME